MTFDDCKGPALTRINRSIDGGTAEETEKWIAIYERLIAIEKAEQQLRGLDPTADFVSPQPVKYATGGSDSEPAKPAPADSLPNEWPVVPELETQVNDLVDLILDQDEAGADFSGTDIEDDSCDQELRAFLAQPECSTTEAIEHFAGQYDGLLPDDSGTKFDRKALRDLILAGKILGRVKGNGGRRIYAICPRSLFLYLNQTPDPRLNAE
jgi:hypothetical protein